MNAFEHILAHPRARTVGLKPEDIRALLEGLSPETWGEKGHKLFEAMEGLDHVQAERVLQEAAKRVGVPLEVMRRAWRDYLGPSTQETASAAQEAVELAQAAGLTLWHTPSREAWATLPLEGHVEHHPIRGASFRYWLAGLYYREKKRPLYAQALQDALTALEAKAIYEGEELPVYLRLAEHGGKVYLDLARPDWKLVEVDPEGWRVIEAHHAPVRFARSRHQRPLPIPEKGGALVGETRTLRLSLSFFRLRINAPGPWSWAGSWALFPLEGRTPSFS